MNNKNAINALLEYRFQTKLLANLLEENGYFDVHIPESESLKIFENTVQQATLICENQLHVPKNLLKKRILNEQVPPGRLARALEWTKAARMAREFEAAKAAEAKAAEEAKLKAIVKVEETPIPIAGVTKGITPSQQEGLGKATAELLSGEALRRAQAKKYNSPEELAKELRDEMTTRFLQAGQESDPRLIELQKRMGGYIDVISPAAIEAAGTMQWGTEPLPRGEGMNFALQTLLNPKYGPERQQIYSSTIPREDLAYEWSMAREELPKVEKELEKEKEVGRAALKGAYYIGGKVGEPEPIIDVFGQPKTTYKQEELKSPESLKAEYEQLAQEGTPKTKDWLEDIRAVMDELRAEYSRRKMEAKITTPEEKASGETLRQKAKTEIEKAQRPRLPETSELIAPPPPPSLTPEELSTMELLRTTIPSGSIVR